MPALIWIGVGAVIALLAKDKLDDTLGGAPSPVSLTGAVVWGLAAFGGVQAFKRFRG